MFYRYEHYMSISHMALIVAIVQSALSFGVAEYANCISAER